jgi:hypothetical protein
MVSTVKKSHAIVLCAWPRMNSRQEAPPRRPARPSPAPVRILRTLVGESWIPRPLSSPTIRSYPHRGFSRASRRTSSRTSRLTLGRPGTPPRIRPVLGDEPAVPRQQRFRGHKERAPPRPGEQPARRGQENTICGPQRRARGLPAKHSKLMAQDDDLELLAIRRAKTQQHERHHPPHHQVHERPPHQLLPSSIEPATLRAQGPRNARYHRTIEFWHPTP